MWRHRLLLSKIRRRYYAETFKTKISYSKNSQSSRWLNIQREKLQGLIIKPPTSHGDASWNGLLQDHTLIRSRYFNFYTQSHTLTMCSSFINRSLSLFVFDLFVCDLPYVNMIIYMYLFVQATPVRFYLRTVNYLMYWANFRY